MDKKLDPQQAAILTTLLAERRMVDDKIAYFIELCAALQHVSLEDHALNLQAMIFVPKLNESQNAELKTDQSN